LEEMSKRGVDISNVISTPTCQTGLSVILARGTDRAILTYTGATTTLKAVQVTDGLLQKARHLHVGSYFLQTALQPGLADLFRRAHALNLTTSLDTNWDPSGQWGDLDEILRQTDIFLPNENEALAITGTRTVDKAVKQIKDICNIMVVKRGAKGALASQGEKSVRLSPIKVDLVDTIGAGDSFDAGFLYGFLKGWKLEESLRLAIVCGSLSTRAAGGTDAQPTLSEAMQYVHVPG